MNPGTGVLEKSHKVEENVQHAQVGAKDKAVEGAKAERMTPPPPQTTREWNKNALSEADQAIFAKLDERQGGSAGNEIVDGEFEKGMKKNTRANQFRVI